MANSDHKFWIGIASAFILPTIAYIYTQGQTAESIKQLAKSVDKFQSNVEIVNDRVSNMSGVLQNNTGAVVVIDKRLERIDILLNDQGNKIVALETRIDSMRRR